MRTGPCTAGHRPSSRAKDGCGRLPETVVCWLKSLHPERRIGGAAIAFRTQPIETTPSNGKRISRIVGLLPGARSCLVAAHLPGGDSVGQSSVPDNQTRYITADSCRLFRPRSGACRGRTWSEPGCGPPDLGRGNTVPLSARTASWRLAPAAALNPSAGDQGDRSDQLLYLLAIAFLMRPTMTVRIAPLAPPPTS